MNVRPLSTTASSGFARRGGRGPQIHLGWGWFMGSSSCTQLVVDAGEALLVNAPHGAAVLPSEGGGERLCCFSTPFPETFRGSRDAPRIPPGKGGSSSGVTPGDRGGVEGCAREGPGHTGPAL